jgi:hypothetical protein
MISTSIISLLVGATLAQRFKVAALLPAMAIVMILAAVTQGALPSLWWFVKMTVIAAVCLQSGFFIGILGRHFMATDPSEASSQLSPAERSTRHAARY